jgi:hypothetical protein
MSRCRRTSGWCKVVVAVDYGVRSVFGLDLGESLVFDGAVAFADPVCLEPGRAVDVAVTAGNGVRAQRLAEVADPAASWAQQIAVWYQPNHEGAVLAGGRRLGAGRFLWPAAQSGRLVTPGAPPAQDAAARLRNPGHVFRRQAGFH